mmetsp:Transcript_13985/g.28167  ORF Transcript_13985/g.28167 Transcript_13985/m.28167 type:complete len:304 (-) Transcript_13985:88-999(-)
MPDCMLFTRKGAAASVDADGVLHLSKRRGVKAKSRVELIGKPVGIHTLRGHKVGVLECRLEGVKEGELGSKRWDVNVPLDVRHVIGKNEKICEDAVGRPLCERPPVHGDGVVFVGLEILASVPREDLKDLLAREVVACEVDVLTEPLSATLGRVSKHRGRNFAEVVNVDDRLLALIPHIEPRIAYMLLGHWSVPCAIRLGKPVLHKPDGAKDRVVRVVGCEELLLDDHLARYVGELRRFVMGDLARDQVRHVVMLTKLNHTLRLEDLATAGPRSEVVRGDEEYTKRLSHGKRLFESPMALFDL